MKEYIVVTMCGKLVRGRVFGEEIKEIPEPMEL